MWDLIIFVALIVIGYVAGRIAESRHYASIRKREKEFAGVMLFASRFPPTLEALPQQLVSGSVVVSDDYFKRVVSGLQSIIGGRLKSYETLLDRARREAVLRMKAEAKAHGARMIVNVKFETFSIPGRKPNSVRAMEVMAYGTALRSA
ncbi:MAG: heavy metal-binding domain-containing protein [Burkholderiales bacterium]|nr:heavy metal-binding domain-containing protein [Burkholderiales bacterium]